MMITITDLQIINLTRTDASTLAQLVKRLSLSELCACAVSDDEAYDIKDAVHQLQNALAKAGFAAR